MFQQRLVVIVNPISGTNPGSVTDYSFLKKLFEKQGFDADIKYTEAPGHAKVIAREAIGEDYYGVIACGGDGTVNEVASALIDTHIPMGIIPKGSGNGLARHLGIATYFNYAVDIIGKRTINTIDCGLANGKPFFCTFGIGFDAAVSERFSRQPRRGLSMYLKSTFEEYLNYSPDEYTIEINGKTITQKAFFITCSNSSQYGNNAFIAPNASICDGEIDITIVHSNDILLCARFGIELLTGFIGTNDKNVETFKAKSINIKRRSEGLVHIDGDPLIMPSEIKISCKPACLKVFAPTTETKFTPLLTPAKLFFRDIGIELKNYFK